MIIILLAPAQGLNFYWVYPVWALVVVVMYPICYWYGEWKSKKPAESIWRFF